MSEPLITVGLHPGYGGRIVLHTIEEVASLIARESEAWGWVRARNGDSRFGKDWAQIWNKLAKPWGVLESAVTAYRAAEAGDDGARAAQVQVITEQLAQFGAEPNSLGSILSSSQVGQWILAQSTPTQLYALSFLLRKIFPASHSSEEAEPGQKIPLPNMTPHRLRAAMDVFLIERGGTEGLAPARAALDELGQQSAEFLGVQKSIASELTEEIRTDRDEWHSKLEEAKRTLDEQLDGAHTRVTELEEQMKTVLAKTGQELDGMKERHRSEIALLKPVEHWETEKKSNQEAGKTWARATIGALIVFAAGLVLGILKLLTLDTGSVTHPIMALGITFIALSLGSIRFFSKQWIAHKNLALAHAEKLAVTQAYLGMLEKAQLQPAERAIALSTIFRSAVSDEREGLSPTTITDAIVRGVGGKS